MIFILVIIIINIILILEQYCINIVDRLPYMLKGAFPDHIRPRPPPVGTAAPVWRTPSVRGAAAGSYLRSFRRICGQDSF